MIWMKMSVFADVCDGDDGGCDDHDDHDDDHHDCC